MEAYLIDRAYQLNNELKYNSRLCEQNAMQLLIEDSMSHLIDDSCKQRAEQGYVPLQSFVLSSNNYHVGVNDKRLIVAKFVPENTTNKGLIYKVYGDKMFEVSSTGVIVGKSPGTAPLTVISKDNPDIKRNVLVTVEETLDAVTQYSLGMLSNVDASVDDADSGTILVKDGDVFVATDYTDLVTLDLSADNDDLWNTIVDNYPSTYAVQLEESAPQRAATVTKTDQQIHITYSIGLIEHSVDLLKQDGIIYRSEYHSQYVE